MDEMVTKTFGCGDQTWPNIDLLIMDAARARHCNEEVKYLRRLLGAIAASGPIRVSGAAYDQEHGFVARHDLKTNELVLEAE